MAAGFSFNARQYFDFTNSEDLQDDTYFDSAPVEKPCILTAENVVEIENSDPESDLFFSPMNTVTSSTTQLRKSLSMGHLPITNARSKGSHSSNVASENGVGKAPSQECINRLAQPKRFASQDDLTLAQAVIQFQVRTPKRFHSKATPRKKQPMLLWHTTQAQSPRLQTTGRVRPSSVLSREERENMELEEARKLKIRAHPVNKKALKGPLKAHVELKPPTTVEPFNLTHVTTKKIKTPEEKKIVFKAQPVPKCLNNPFKPQCSGQLPTKGHSPSFSKKLTQSISVEKSEKSVQAPHNSYKPTKTELKPFSFERRDQLLLQKKEELTKRVLEEEKKAREFHARPMPKSILRAKNCSEENLNETGSVRSQRRGSSEDINTVIFKARPATVLSQKPFEPKRDEKHCLKIEAFQLATDSRLEARHKFEEKLKEKEAAAEAMKKRKEEEQQRLEREEVAQLRKQMEHRAQPIKKYKEISIQHEHKITNPVSPRFHTDKIRNKENVKQ